MKYLEALVAQQKEKVELRCEYFGQTGKPVLELSMDEEIVSVDHEGSSWWVYIMRYVYEGQEGEHE